MMEAWNVCSFMMITFLMICVRLLSNFYAKQLGNDVTYNLSYVFKHDFIHLFSLLIHLIRCYEIVSRNSLYSSHRNNLANC